MPPPERDDYPPWLAPKLVKLTAAAKQKGYNEDEIQEAITRILPKVRDGTVVDDPSKEEKDHER
jgi:hypothetical protein